MPSIILCGLISLIISFFIQGLIERWIEVFSSEDALTLTLYSPYDWYTMRWSASILVGLILSFPLFCRGLYTFMESGLFERERNAIQKLFFTVSLAVPTAILFIIYITPKVASLAVLSDEMDGVEAMIDPVSIAKFSLSVSWIFTIIITLICILSTTRILIPDFEQNTSIRMRFHLIFGALLIVVMADNFDGLRLVIIFGLAIISESISKLISSNFRSTEI